MDLDELTIRTGWTIHHRTRAASTNDLAAALIARGAGARTAVVADEQTAGRGRQGRRFLSPPGGLYVSLLLKLPAAPLPGAAVALAGVAAAEAIEAVCAVQARLKWPNDVWIGGRKAGGILLEMADGAPTLVLGIGLNLGPLPPTQARELGVHVTSLAEQSGARVDRAALLGALLVAVDDWTRALARPTGAEALEAAWRSRMALLGEQVVFLFVGRELGGRLEDVSLRHGLLVRDPISGPVWRQGELVQDLRAAGRTIS